MRIAVLILAALAATGCGARDSQSGSGTSGRTQLEISVTPGGEAPTKVWTLSCPDSGTLPDPARACRRLDEIDQPFAPTPQNAKCTLVYGGAQVADVRGTFRGRPVNAHFSRENGCEIERWDAVRFLFPSR